MEEPEKEISLETLLSMTKNTDELVISEKRKDTSLSLDNRSYYYEIKSMNKIIKFDYLIFKNYYVASISLIAFNDDEKTNLITNRVLMNDPNVEEDSERYFIISSKEFELEENQFKELKITSLRLYIFQPSLYWKTYFLDNIKFINSLNQSQEQKIYYEISPKNKYIFKEENFQLIDDPEEISQKYIDIAKRGGGNAYSKLSFLG